MENARVYEDLLNEIGIAQPLSETPSKIPLPNIPTCCTGDTNDIIILDGAHVCWQCGNTVDFSVYVFYNPYTAAGKPVGHSNTITIERKRGYKSLTHFKEHLRRYMGARFGEYPKDMIEKMRGSVAVDDPNCYRDVQSLLKRNGHRKMYKEIFTIIYALGGTKPGIDNKVFDACVTDFMWLQARFTQMKKMSSTGRKNMPSMYVLLDLLLKRNGHQPFYTIPYLKDENLQSNVMSIFDILNGSGTIE